MEIIYEGIKTALWIWLPVSIWLLCIRERDDEKNLGLDMTIHAPKEDSKIKCANCKHYVDKWDCQKITIDTVFSLYSGGDYNEFYCKLCTKPYDSIEKYDGKITYYKTIPESQMEVTKEGKKVK